MTLPNPKFAPRRNDLPWLRRRRRPPSVAPAGPTAAQAAPAKAAPVRPAPVRPASAKAAPAKAAPVSSGSPHASGGRIDYTRRDRAKPAPTPAPARPPVPAPPRAHPAPAPAATTASANPLDLSAPTPAPTAAPAPARDRPTPVPAPPSGNPLDLSAPTPAPTPAPTQPTPAAGGGGAGTSLDLGGPPTAAPTSAPAPTSPRPPTGSPGPAASTSLDLGSPPAPAPGAPRRPAPPPRADRHHVVRRTRPGATTLLDFGAPVVTLDRLQSGIGELTVDAVVGGEVGDLRIGAAWALTDGRTGTVELDADRRHGPNTRRPVVWAQKEGRFERIALDLRQTRSLARLLVYGFSPSRASLSWGGTVVVTTYGGDRVEAPIVSPPSPAVLALVSVYNVDGEFVVRSEMDPVAGTVRDTCRAFGYDRITWLDDRTPVS